MADEPYDVVIYGDTSAAVTAGITATRCGADAVIIAPKHRLGGMTTNGLGWTDIGDDRILGGIAREFYARAWDYYTDPLVWTWTDREAFDLGGSLWNAEDELAGVFEPHVAVMIYDELLADAGVPVETGKWLDREDGVEVDGGRVVSITTLDGTTYRGDVFIDATYEGDLYAAAGIEYTVGREGIDAFDEEWAGVQKGANHHRHNFAVLDEPVDPYVDAGNPDSGLLPLISSEAPGENGQADERLQAFNYRLCLTDVPENRIDWTEPDGYDPAEFELLIRVYEAGWREQFQKFDPIPNGKTDVNNHGPVSTDHIGASYDYPEASYEERQAIEHEHVRYQRSYFHFVATDPRVPDEIQSEMNRWGLAADEFTENDHWPEQIYVREARRLVGTSVMTEHEVLGRRDVEKSVGMGAYTLDSHHVQRYIDEDGAVQNEGDIGVSPPTPYEISYDALTPKAAQCPNVLVPVALSSSHIAFGSIRMEPVYMILGQSAATAAAMAAERDIAVQDVPYDELAAALEADDQRLTLD